MACETLTTTNMVVLAGEIRCKGVYENDQWAPGALAEIEKAVRDTVKRIGYEQSGFHWETFNFSNNLHAQSAHIAMGVDESGNKDEGAGDQGIMFGYATDETPDLLPATLYYSHRILRAAWPPTAIPARRRSSSSDAKSQVTLQYEGGVPVRASALVVSTQHSAELSNDAGQAKLRDYVKGVFADVLPKGWLPEEDKIYVNPTGLFEIGGPDGDAGLTGRKIIVDTYGGAAPHGGGAFSGKDPTKVDRSAAYVARYLAKNVVAAGLASAAPSSSPTRIGIAEPLSVYVDTHGTGTVDEAEARGRAAQAGAPDAEGHSRASEAQQADLPRSPPPTAISAARRRATISPGSAPTSSTRWKAAI